MGCRCRSMGIDAVGRGVWQFWGVEVEEVMAAAREGWEWQKNG